MSTLLILPYVIFSVITISVVLVGLACILGPGSWRAWAKIRLKPYKSFLDDPLDIVLHLFVALVLITVGGMFLGLFAEFIRCFAPSLIDSTGVTLFLRACSLATVIFWVIIYVAERHRKQQPRS